MNNLIIDTYFPDGSIPQKTKQALKELICQIDGVCLDNIPPLRVEEYYRHMKIQFHLHKVNEVAAKNFFEKCCTQYKIRRRKEQVLKHQIVTSRLLDENIFLFYDDDDALND